MEEKTDRTHKINHESHDNDSKVKEDILKIYEENHNKKTSIQEQEKNTKE